MVLGLPEQATMEEIRSAYRALIRKWHPDSCTGNREECKEMTIKIIRAYGTINDYCKNYRFSFSKGEVRNYLSAEEWWFERFGHTPLWSDDQK